MNKDILLVIETVANEKNVSKDIIVDAMEHALAGAVKKKYRLEEKKDIEEKGFSNAALMHSISSSSKLASLDIQAKCKKNL